MTVPAPREPRAVQPMDVFDRLDQMFEDWTRRLPFRMPTRLGREPAMSMAIHLDEYREGNELHVRAELPGVDPERDVSVTVTDHDLQIEAERREEEKAEGKGFIRRELRYGRLSRMLRLPEGVSDSDVSATYHDGILDITVTLPEAATPTKIPVSKS